MFSCARAGSTNAASACMNQTYDAPPLSRLFQSADVTCADFEEGCNGLEDVAAAVGGGTFAPKISRILTAFRWFQLFTDRLVRWPRLRHAMSPMPHPLTHSRAGVLRKQFRRVSRFEKREEKRRAQATNGYFTATLFGGRSEVRVTNSRYPSDERRCRGRCLRRNCGSARRARGAVFLQRPAVLEGVGARLRPHAHSTRRCNLSLQDSVLAASWKEDIHKRSACRDIFPARLTRSRSVFAVLKSKSVQGSSGRR
jgi:hypothetical protein